MNNSIFRKKSLDRISSPEQLNDYIRVSTPSVWMVLFAIIILTLLAFTLFKKREIKNEQE